MLFPSRPVPAAENVSGKGAGVQTTVCHPNRRAHLLFSSSASQRRPEARGWRAILTDNLQASSARIPICVFVCVAPTKARAPQPTPSSVPSPLSHMCVRLCSIQAPTTAREADRGAGSTGSGQCNIWPAWGSFNAAAGSEVGKGDEAHVWQWAVRHRAAPVMLVHDVCAARP